MFTGQTTCKYRCMPAKLLSGGSFNLCSYPVLFNRESLRSHFMVFNLAKLHENTLCYLSLKGPTSSLAIGWSSYRLQSLVLLVRTSDNDPLNSVWQERGRFQCSIWFTLWVFNLVYYMNNKKSSKFSSHYKPLCCISASAHLGAQI